MTIAAAPDNASANARAIRPGGPVVAVAYSTLIRPTFERSTHWAETAAKSSAPQCRRGHSSTTTEGQAPTDPEWGSRCHSHVARAGPILPRPVLRETRAELAAARERAGVRVISRTRCSGDFDHQVLATPAHRVRQITLTLPSPGVPGEGSCRARAIALQPVHNSLWHRARGGSIRGGPRRAHQHFYSRSPPARARTAAAAPRRNVMKPSGSIDSLGRVAGAFVCRTAGRRNVSAAH